MNGVKTGVLMLVLFGLFMLLGQVIGGSNGLVYGFVIALVINFFAYWFSDKVALMMSRAVEVTPAEAPELHAIVHDLASRAGLPMPRVYLIPSPQPNAFATGRSPSHASVAVTESLLQMLPHAELEGVLAHELAHVKHRDILICSVAATIAGAIGMIAQLLRFELFFGGMGGDDRDNRSNPLLALLAAMLVGFVAMLVQLAISRAREYEADRGGAQITGNPLALATALRHIEGAVERRPVSVNPAASHMYIVNPGGGDLARSFLALFRTHPLTEDRIARLEAMAYSPSRS